MGCMQSWRSLASDTELAFQAAILRDIIGNPFRPPPTIDPTWLHWGDSTIPKLAQAIHDSRNFRDLPVLADALEEAGCTDTNVLGHLREPGVHGPGCHVLDALLSRK